MAEAHSAVALSFSVGHDGVSVSYDQELLREIWHSCTRVYKRRVARFKNDFVTGIYPASVKSLIFTVAVVTAFRCMRLDLSLGLIPWIQGHLFHYLLGDGWVSRVTTHLSCSVLLWFAAIQLMRVGLKWLLSYKGWMYENPFERPVSKWTKLWLWTLSVIARSEPMTHAFEGALPHLPLPKLDDTLRRHLITLRPILSDEEFEEVQRLSEVFQRGIGRRLQRYLWLKSLITVNYVTDWWEQFVYLRQRAPIMVNSNYYGLDTLTLQPTTIQAARAAHVTHVMLRFRRMIERQEITPFSLSKKTKVPFCTMQYERIFNSTRIPGDPADTFTHWPDSRHVAVLHRGVWYKLLIHNGKRLLNAIELERSFQAILDEGSGVPADDDDWATAESKVAALTAGERGVWARARRDHFARGVNKTSLHAIERAAFVVVLDTDAVDYDPGDFSKVDNWAGIMLHGNGKNRWFDKSFNLIVTANAKMGINAEHSWADAAIAAHFMEYTLIMDNTTNGYDEAGHCAGTAQVNLIPQRLKFEIDDECAAAIEESAEVASALIKDVEMALLVWREYGKGAMKRLRCSPDAFIQLVLQLTYFRNQGKFSLTYEASMTRLFREGRTETVRSCTQASCDFVRAMLDPEQTREERVRLLREASDFHQQSYRDAMCGKGVDRHLFGLYVVKRFLEEESPFLDKVFPPTYLLSTSQTPLAQCEDSDKLSEQCVSAGGGFGPVADKGYGVSYVLSGESTIGFHISSKYSAENTSSARFRELLIESLRDMRALFNEDDDA